MTTPPMSIPAVADRTDDAVRQAFALVHDIRAHPAGLWPNAAGAASLRATELLSVLGRLRAALDGHHPAHTAAVAAEITAAVRQVTALRALFDALATGTITPETFLAVTLGTTTPAAFLAAARGAGVTP